MLANVSPRESDYKFYLKMRKGLKDAHIIAVGGGGVIDVAKIIAYPRQCLAYPQTASGASMTSTATLWGRKKITLYLKKPYDTGLTMPVLLNDRVRHATRFDCLSHIVESLWSNRKTKKSKEYCLNGLSMLKKHDNDFDLVEAGRWAGQAIEITKTNIIHAISYPITLMYDVPHGRALAMIFNEVVKYVNYQLPQLPEFERTLLPDFFNVDRMANEALKYEKIQDGPKKITREAIITILRRSQTW